MTLMNNIDNESNIDIIKLHVRDLYNSMNRYYIKSSWCNRMHIYLINNYANKCIFYSNIPYNGKSIQISADNMNFIMKTEDDDIIKLYILNLINKNKK